MRSRSGARLYPRRITIVTPSMRVDMADDQRVGSVPQAHNAFIEAGIALSALQWSTQRHAV